MAFANLVLQREQEKVIGSNEMPMQSITIW